MRTPLAALLLCTVSLPAWALSDPTPSPRDTMVRTVAYDPLNRVPLTIQQGGIVVVTFDPSETIEQVVKTGDAPFTYACDNTSNDQKQQCEASYTNNLPLVGRTSGAADLVVLTRQKPDDRERSYIFAVTVTTDGKDPTITKHLTFTYGAGDRPSEPKADRPLLDREHVASDDRPPARPMTWKEKKAKAENDIYIAALQSDPAFGDQNYRYVVQGRDRNIAPVAASDNYHITGFRYPGNMPQPSIFKVEDGVQGPPAVCTGGHSSGAELTAPEQAVNTVVRQDVIVVHETWPHWRLRSGEQVVDIWNCAYNAIGYNPGTGTDDPNVVRRVIRR